MTTGNVAERHDHPWNTERELEFLIGCSEAYFGQTEIAVLKSAFSRWLDDPATVEAEYLRIDNRYDALAPPPTVPALTETLRPQRNQRLREGNEW